MDKAVFPGLQGGPLVNSVAAKALAFREAMQASFRDYARRIVENASRLSARLAEQGYPAVSGGTDNHLFLLDLTRAGVTGVDVERGLDRAALRLPDIVLMDLWMPGSTGIQACARFRQHRATAAVPLILMSAQWQ